MRIYLAFGSVNPNPWWLTPPSGKYSFNISLEYIIIFFADSKDIIFISSLFVFLFPTSTRALHKKTMGASGSKGKDDAAFPNGVQSGYEITPDDKLAVLRYYRERKEGGDTVFAAQYPDVASFAAYWAVPPPVVLNTHAGVESWRAQCLGETWMPPAETAPGLSLLRWHLPPRTEEWRELYTSETHGWSSKRLFELCSVYPGPTVLCVRLPYGTLGVVVHSWPKRQNDAWKPEVASVAFFAIGRKLVCVDLKGEGVADVDADDEWMRFGPLHVSSSLQRCETHSSELHKESEHTVRQVEVWGVGSSAHGDAFLRRTETKRMATENARKVNRRHMAGDTDADRFILQAAGVLNDAYRTDS